MAKSPYYSNTARSLPNPQRQRDSSPASLFASLVTDGLPTAMAWLVAALVTAAFLWILSDILWQGAGQLSWEFLTAAPVNAGRGGGIGPILISTALILIVCIVVSIPIGVGTAILLSEFTSMESLFGRLVRRSLDVLAGVPSIVFGLFGNVFFCQVDGLRRTAHMHV